MAFVTYPCDIKPSEVTAFFNVVCFHKSIFISSAFIAAYPTLLYRFGFYSRLVQPYC